MSLFGGGVVSDAGRGVALEVDQRVPVGAFLGVMTAAAAPLLLCGRLDLAFLVSVHDSALL